MWLVYWLFLIISFFFGINVFIKKHEFSGIVQSLLSFALPIWALFLSLHRDLTQNVNELEFILLRFLNGQIDAILIVFGYIALIITFIYNLYNLKN